MKRKTAFLAFALVTALAACAPKTPTVLPGPGPLPLTAENVARCRELVERAKAQAPKPENLQEFTAYAARVYVRPLGGLCDVPATMAEALRLETAGDRQAGDLLRLTLSDLELTAALTGLVFTREEWREIVVRSGLMRSETFGRLEEAASRRSRTNPLPPPNEPDAGPMTPGDEPGEEQ